MKHPDKLPLAKLSTITTKIGSGATPRGGKESYKDSGITLIRSLNVYDFHFEYDGLAFIDDDQAEELTNVEVREHDILLNITGASVARCCMVPVRLLPARVNQHVALVRVSPAIADPHYVLYCINSPNHKRRLLTLAQGGATREALTKETIENFEIPLPPLPTQRRIASILSAYDDLIENNTRRIRILEEMAQLLYREWFVHFRFPGHERVKMKNGVPEGWEAKRVGEIAEVNASNIKKGEEPTEINYVDIASVSTGQINEITRLPFESAPGRARRIVKHGDIIWSCVRPNRKSYSLILNPPPNLIVSTGFAVITAKQVPYTYLYHSLTTDDFVSYLTNHATGAAYPAVTATDFEKAEVLLPAQDVLDSFHAIIADMQEQGHVLSQKNANLRQTRDLLLPWLVNGEVDVSEVSTDEQRINGY